MHLLLAAVFYSLPPWGRVAILLALLALLAWQLG